MDRYVSINLNSQVLVKLNEEGYKHWKAKNELTLPNQYCKPLEDYKGRANEEGYVEFQLWHFMELFGQTINFGGHQYFDINILIKEKELL